MARATMIDPGNWTGFSLQSSKLSWWLHMTMTYKSYWKLCLRRGSLYATKCLSSDSQSHTHKCHWHVTQILLFHIGISHITFKASDLKFQFVLHNQVSKKKVITEIKCIDQDLKAYRHYCPKDMFPQTLVDPVYIFFGYTLIRCGN